MKKEILGLLTAIIFAGKYIQAIPFIQNFGYQINFILSYWGNIIIDVSFALIFLFSYFLISKRWRFYSMTLAIIGISSFLFSLFYSDILFYVFSQILLFTSFFFLLYPLCHYEIRKYASFGYSFSLIYVLFEGTSLWRNDFYPLIFLIYLTLTLIIFIPGILKIKENL